MRRSAKCWRLSGCATGCQVRASQRYLVAAESPGSASISICTMQVQACRSDGCDVGRNDRDGPGSNSGEGKRRGLKDTEEGAKRRGDCVGSPALVCDALDWMAMSGCVAARFILSLGSSSDGYISRERRSWA
ncbi:hypothetical protein BC834DRAFT_911986 [Gloeopeniophorella convolvens]|nr:hypothetical protein BC834DRAFT_911986 [Gloeopeniophorella convolvens]